MSLLIKGGGRKAYDDDYIIEVPKDETPVYLEWTLWRAALAIDHLVNKPYEVRGFRLDSDFYQFQQRVVEKVIFIGSFKILPF